MSRLDALIKEHCPYGVEFVQLNTILDYEQPTKYIVEATNYDDSFETPVLTAGQTFILGYTNENDGIYTATKETPTIIFDDFTTSFHWVDFSFKVKSSAMKMLRIKPKKADDALFRYVYHCMGNINYKPVDHSRQWIAKYAAFKIPLPPVLVQAEIVRILDNFTELTARKEQYEYYRDSVFGLEKDTKHEPLKNYIKSLKTGLNPRKNFVLNTDDATNYYVTVREIVNGKIVFFDKTDKVNDNALKLINNRSNLEIGDVLFSGTGTVGRTAVIENTPTNWNIKEGVYTIKTNNEKMNSKYLAYLLNTKKIVDLYSKKIVGSPVCSLPMAELKKLLIPIPYSKDTEKSLAEQQRIVNILDRFDTLCNDISSGLPAEIKAREEQYEYYRNKLLTFKEKEA